MKHLLLLNGHPAKDGFSMDIIDRYEATAKAKGHVTERFELGNMDFNSDFGVKNLSRGCRMGAGSTSILASFGESGPYGNRPSYVVGRNASKAEGFI